MRRNMVFFVMFRITDLNFIKWKTLTIETDSSYLYSVLKEHTLKMLAQHVYKDEQTNEQTNSLLYHLQFFTFL